MSALAQLIVDEPVFCCRGDRLLIRDHGEQITLGGGTVLDPCAPRRGKARAERRVYLHAMEHADPAVALCTAVQGIATGIDYDAYRSACNLDSCLLRQFADRSALRRWGDAVAVATKSGSGISMVNRARAVDRLSFVEPQAGGPRHE